MCCAGLRERERCLSSLQAGETEESKGGWLQWSSRVYIFAFDCPPYHIHKHRHSSNRIIWNINLIKNTASFVCLKHRLLAKVVHLFDFCASTPLEIRQKWRSWWFGGMVTLYIWIHYEGHIYIVPVYRLNKDLIQSTFKSIAWKET